jgi:hypothetical protein
MGTVARIDFEERDHQWFVTLVDTDGNHSPGEPFPASGHERHSKLEQVLHYVQEHGYHATRTPYNKVNESHYILAVAPA